MGERLYEYTKITDLKDMLKKSGEKFGNKTAYQIKIEPNKYKYFSHKEVREMIDSLGTSLINIGLKDKRIAVIGENRYEWEIAYLSIVCGTGIVVPLDKSLPENELKNLIARSGVEAIFYTKKYQETLETIKKQGVGKLKHLISMDSTIHKDGIYSESELIEVGKELIKKGDRRFIDSKIDSEKMSIMLFTSGTTSKSKIVALSHKNICSNLMDIASILDVNENDVFLSFLPLHHVFECTVGFLFSLYKGAKTVFCDGMRHIQENLVEYHASIMASVPAIYERICKVIYKELDKKGKLEETLKLQEQYKNASMEEKKEVFKDIHEALGGNVKLFISGAAALDPGVEADYRKFGINLVQGYGLTETSPVVAVGSKKYYKTGSIGLPVPSVEVKLADVNKEGIGELLVKGPSVMLEYFENREETRKALTQDGWFYTGDLAKIDNEGYIFICGRKKSVIVLKNGKNIFPEEMENIINRIEGVNESFIFGKQVSSDKDDIKICAKIVYDRKTIENAYKVKTDDEIFKAISGKIKEINQALPHYKAIRGIILSEEPLIKTTTNKIKRQNNLELIMKEESKWNLKI